jgi:diacylglycerol kinase family enzyme
MDGGQLGVHWSQTSSRLGLLVLIASYAFNFMRLNPQVTMREAPEVVIRTRHRTCEADLDGEVICLESPMTYRIQPQSLQVLAPPQRQNDSAPGRQ